MIFGMHPVIKELYSFDKELKPALCIPRNRAQECATILLMHMDKLIWYYPSIFRRNHERTLEYGGTNSEGKEKLPRFDAGLSGNGGCEHEGSTSDQKLFLQGTAKM